MDFAELVGDTPDEDQFVWTVGRYVILHFDLVQTTGMNRDDARVAIAGCTAVTRAKHVGGSVYLVPTASAERGAALFWNRLHRATDGLLVEGDSFYVHYSGDKKNQIGAIAQVVSAGADALSTVKVPDAG